MINFLKSLFFQTDNIKANHQKNYEIEKQNIESGIYFLIEEQTNKIEIKLIFKTLDQATSKIFADLLFHINEGYYAQSIIEILNDIGSKGPEEFKCVQKIIKNWGNKIIEVEQEEQLANNEPIIAPSLFGHTTDNNN